MNIYILTRSFQKYTGIFVKTTKGVLDWKLYPKDENDAKRLDFLNKTILLNNKEKLFIMNNASSHKTPYYKRYSWKKYTPYIINTLQMSLMII